MGAHLTSFPASYGWMHDPQKYVVEQDHATLPVQLRPFDDSGNGDFKNGILFSSESRGFSESQVRDLWPIINAVSADTADRVYDLPVMKAFPAISDWYQEQFAQPCTQDLDDSYKATSFDYIRQLPGKFFCELLLDRSRRVSVFGPDPANAAKRLVGLMEKKGALFVQRVVEIVRAAHKAVTAHGFQFGESETVDESNVVFYCSSVRASKDGRRKAFPYTDRSDPFMFAKPDEGQQGVTVIIPITGPVPLVTHQGSPQMVRSLVTLTER